MSANVNNLYFYFDDLHYEYPQYSYVIGENVFDAVSKSHTFVNKQWTLVQPFTINLNRSEIIALTLKLGHSYTPMLYQWDFNENKLYELIPRPQGYQTIVREDDLSVLGESSWYNLERPDDITYILDNFVSYTDKEDTGDEEEEEEEWIPSGFRYGVTDIVVKGEVDSRFPNGITNEVFDLILQQRLKLQIDNLYYGVPDGKPKYYYQISDQYYDASDLSPSTINFNLLRLPIFEVNMNGSSPYILLFLNSQNQGYPMIYQPTKKVKELTSRPPADYNKLINLTEIQIPMITPGGIFKYSSIYSNNVSVSALKKLIGMEGSWIFDRIVKTPTHYTHLPNTSPTIISLQQIEEMLSKNQIERWEIDPSIQNPAENNKILSFFGYNGTTYLVKARYDQATNQIFPPVL